MSTTTNPAQVLTPNPPTWASLSAILVRRLPLARYRVMNWVCRRSLARFVARIPVSARGLRFECDLRNSLAREVFFTGCYEPQETMVIRHLVAPGGTFVDVGAHWGYFSLIMAEHLGSSGRVVAIEADPRIYAILERSVALNDLPQVRLVQAAAAAESGILPLIGFDERDNNWGTSRIAGGSGAVGALYEVPARSVDDLLDELGLDAVDLIKIDIEGAESLALAGMYAGLRRGRYRRMMLELHPTLLAEHGTDAAAIIEGLLEIGYRGWVIAQTAEDVRRAAYHRRRPVDSFLRPLQWPEPLDTWPHLIFVQGDCPLYADGTKVAGTGSGRGYRVRRDGPLDATFPVAQRPAAGNEDFEPILIVGHPRSGTTLLATILNRHSQVAIPPETSFFLPAFRHYRHTAARDGSHEAMLDYLREIPNTIECMEKPTPATFMKGPATPADLFRCMLTEYAAARGKPRCGEKSPLHLLAIPELLASYPRARVVCLIRDGRDVVRSCRGMPFFTWEPDWWHCQTWCRAAALAERYRRQDPDRFLICRFEALVEDPVEEVKRVDEFLGLAFEPAQLEGSGCDEVSLDSEWWKNRARQPPDRGRAYSWRQSCEAREAQYLTGLMEPWLAHFGYDTFTSPSVAGPRWRYPGYRALAYLLRVSQVSHRLSGAVVPACQRLVARFTSAG
jgi:FkbM family methyltransferase